MSKYNFYYDESEHSRKINLETVSASNYYDNFVTMIIGWSSDNEEILQKHAAFEEKYADRKDQNGELKSKTLQQKRFKHGFASLNKQNVQFVNDFLSLFNEEVHIYFSVVSKIEHLILQLLDEYENNLVIDADSMKYSIIKAIVRYRPKELIKSIYETPENFLKELKEFFRDRIKKNKGNLELKQAETRSFEEILLILDDISKSPDLNWDYHMSFDGFNKYLQEKGIQDYHLIIDKEGEEGEISHTLQAALDIELRNSEEANSMTYSGLRMADMMAGIISKLLKALSDASCYKSIDDGINKKVLDSAWFRLTEQQLSLYKKLYTIICQWQPAWYKSYSGIYSDDLVVFNALLNFMNHFNSAEHIQEKIEMQGEYFNAFACEQLSSYFKLRSCKLPIEPVIPINEDMFLNQRGATMYFDSEKQPKLKLNEGSQVFDVLSVGVDGNFVPSATIVENGQPICYKLPQELSEWAMSLVGMAVMGTKMFPSKVKFSKIKGKYYADIL